MILQKVKLLKPTSLDHVHVVRYADDFVVTGTMFRDLFDNIIIPAIIQFLGIRGLQLNLVKSKLLELLDRKEGFDFLGVNLKYVVNMLKPGTAVIDFSD